MRCLLVFSNIRLVFSKIRLVFSIRSCRSRVLVGQLVRTNRKCLCVCVCVREREREREKEREKTIHNQ